MVTVLIAVFVIILIAVVISAIIYYAPIIPAALKNVALYVVGAVAVLLIVLELLKLFGVAVPI